MKMRLFGLVIFAIFAFACGEKPATNANSNVRNTAVNNNANTNKPAGGAVQNYTYEIVNTYAHDPKAFTQGLVFHNGFLYETTGGSRKNGDNFFSSLRKVELETGKVVQKFDLADEYFGEGMTIFGDKVYQITWRENTAFVYDLNTFKLIREFKYQGEGWGLTTDGTNLIMSDGTHVIRFVNPENFETVRTIVVLDEKGKPLMELNELEYIKGEIWANVWQTGEIVRIDPASGKLLGVIDLEKLAEDEMDKDKNADVLNGIAYDAASDRLFITGKRWRRLFEVKIKPKQ
jgi:glutamine cyclotransferase